MATIHPPVILHDGLPIAQDPDPFAFLLRYQAQSVDYALTEGGYSIVTDQTDIRGWMGYLLRKDRRGYGIDGWTVREIENLRGLVNSSDCIIENDWYFCNRILLPLLHALGETVNYWSGNGGDLSLVAMQLQDWLHNLAKRANLLDENGALK
jgi:hypothetical protein